MGSARFLPGNGHSILAATGKDGLLNILSLPDGKLMSKSVTTTIANASAPITTSGTLLPRRDGRQRMERRSVGIAHASGLRELGRLVRDGQTFKAG